MISTGAYNYINVLQKASEASAKRHEVISNNIANVDTPNYKRQELDFGKMLSGAFNRTTNLDEAVANMDLDALEPNVYRDNKTLSYRLDGNNVDVETENAYLAENQLRYYTLIDSISQEFTRLQSVIK